MKLKRLILKCSQNEEGKHVAHSLAWIRLRMRFPYAHHRRSIGFKVIRSGFLRNLRMAQILAGKNFYPRK